MAASFGSLATDSEQLFYLVSLVSLVSGFLHRHVLILIEAVPVVVGYQLPDLVIPKTANACP